MNTMNMNTMNMNTMNMNTMNMNNLMMRHLLNTSSDTLNTSILVEGDDNRSIGSGCSNISTLSTTSTRYGHGHGHGKPEYTCNDCGKSFKHKSNLKIHYIIHTDQA
eukprot:480920_1